jgi:hypothetical protein
MILVRWKSCKVEIAQAEEQDAILVLAFGVEVLLADRGDFVGGHLVILIRKCKMARDLNNELENAIIIVI